jgi:glycosyltransferase involved in cell wall biosynthesis
VIGGEGELTEKYRVMVQGLGVGDRVWFPGSFFNDYNGKMEAFRDANVTVLPSRHEGLGTVLLEAMAQTCPVIASRVGGLPYVVPDEFCLYEPGNTTELKEKINRVLLDASMRLYLSQLGYEKARDFYIGIIQKRYITLVKSLLKNDR